MLGQINSAKKGPPRTINIDLERCVMVAEHVCAQIERPPLGVQVLFDVLASVQGDWNRGERGCTNSTNFKQGILEIEKRRSVGFVYVMNHQNGRTALLTKTIHSF
jgi:hypothetical protein